MEELPLKPKRGRKQKIPGQSRSERKRRANNNEDFFNERGTLKKAKVFREITWCCVDQCFKRLFSGQQEEIFESFHSLGSFERRALFFANNIHSVVTKKASGSDNSVKRLKYSYTLNDVRVCAGFFKNLLQIDSRRSMLALKKFRTLNIQDMRGIFAHPKLSNEKEKFIIDLIKSIPKYVSHYCREVSSSKYLGSEWDLAKLHRLCTSLWSEKNPNQSPVSISKFTEVFNRFNLKFKGRNKDTCNICDVLDMRRKAGDDVKEMIDKHHDKALSLRKLMFQDLEAAVNDDSLEVLTFDFQKVQPLPRLETNLVYYLRKLSHLNFGIHSGKMKQGFFYPWLENQAGRGADQVGSCLRHHITEFVKTPVKTLIMYSDCCGGQNRNYKLCLILKKILDEHPSLNTIKLRFLQSGHSFLPNDQEFGHYERLIQKQQQIELPSDYVNLMKEAHSHAKKIQVVEMKHNNFVASTPLKKLVVLRKQTKEKEKVEYMKTHQIKMLKENPSELFFQYFPIDDTKVKFLLTRNIKN